jgi:hypothetical protein
MDFKNQSRWLLAQRNLVSRNITKSIKYFNQRALIVTTQFRHLVQRIGGMIGLVCDVS